MCLSKGGGCCNCNRKEDSVCHRCGQEHDQSASQGQHSQDIHKILFQKLVCIQKKIEGLEEKVEAIGYRLYEEIESVGQQIDELTKE